MRATSLMTASNSSESNVKVGDRIRIIQQIPHGVECWISNTEGVVLSFAQEKTGAWFAHSRDKKLWLDRIVIRQDNGEVSSCILDRYSRIEQADADPVAQAAIRDRGKNAELNAVIENLVGRHRITPSYPAHVHGSFHASHIECPDVYPAA